MNILKKSFLFAMPAMMAGCGDNGIPYVITDKDIETRQIVIRDPDSVEHVMAFHWAGQDSTWRRQDSLIFEYLSPGDTLYGSNMDSLVMTSQKYLFNNRTLFDRIRRVNGVRVHDWLIQKRAAMSANVK